MFTMFLFNNRNNFIPMNYDKSNNLLNEEQAKILVNYVIIYKCPSIETLLKDFNDIPKYYEERDKYILCLDNQIDIVDRFSNYNLYYKIIETKEINYNTYNNTYAVYKSYKPNEKYCLVNKEYLTIMKNNNMQVF